jgi:hypothetical protein
LVLPEKDKEKSDMDNDDDDDLAKMCSDEETMTPLSKNKDQKGLEYLEEELWVRIA